MTETRDHGGGLDAAITRYGGTRAEWLDLSTGINPVPYPIPDLPADAWTALPDRTAADSLIAAARKLWNVPGKAGVLPTHGASAAIARIPSLAAAGTVAIPGPTYNEHAAAFRSYGWRVSDTVDQTSDATVVVHPNNPDGRWWNESDLNAPLTVIDESFCDIAPGRSLIHLAENPGTLVVKSFGKFWGLAGLRLGFVIGDSGHVARLRDGLGPWSVSGPALSIGAKALGDTEWAANARDRLNADAARLDSMMVTKGADLLGGTSLFRLYNVDDAVQWQDYLAKSYVWTRVFPYSRTWLRLGLPAPDRWSQLEAAL